MSNVSGIRHQDGRRAACRTLNTFRLVPHVLDVVHVMRIRINIMDIVTRRVLLFLVRIQAVSSATSQDPPTKYRQTDATRRVLSSKTHHLVMPANDNGDGHVDW